MSKITNNGLTHSGTRCFIAVPIWQQGAPKYEFAKTEITAVTVCLDAEEYCLPEVFHAECAVGEVVVMEKAKFGRMELGRCVTRNYGNIGCAVDVLSTLDDACSGHRACDLSVSDSALVRTKPCPKDFAAYLDAVYRCVPGKHHCISGLLGLRKMWQHSRALIVTV